MSWSDIPNSDIDVDSVIRANVLGTFRDNQIETRRFGFPWVFAATPITATSFGTTLQSLEFTVPNVEGTAPVRQIIVRLKALVSAAGTLTLRLNNITAAVLSPEVVVTETAYTWKTLTLTVAEALRGTNIAVTIQGKVASGGQTGSIFVPDSLACEFRY